MSTVQHDAASVTEAYRAFQALCAFCSWALYADPDEQTLSGLAEGRAMFCEAPFSQVAPEAGQELAHIFEEASQSPETLRALMAQIRRDRTYLFRMTNASQVSPYESVWLSDDATMFGPQTLAVRQAYKQAGFVFENAAKEPDDHIGLEFSFAAHLFQAAAEGDGQAPARLRAFLSSHLLAFGPACLARIADRARTPYFRAVVGIAAGTLEALAEQSDAAGKAQA